MQKLQDSPQGEQHLRDPQTYFQMEPQFRQADPDSQAFPEDRFQKDEYGRVLILWFQMWAKENLNKLKHLPLPYVIP